MALKNLTQMEPLVLKITGRDELGRVRHLEVLYDHERVDVSNPLNREFVIAHVPRGLMKQLVGKQKTSAN